jgi:hypothetical protein
MSMGCIPDQQFPVKADFLKIQEYFVSDIKKLRIL